MMLDRNMLNQQQQLEGMLAIQVALDVLRLPLVEDDYGDNDQSFGALRYTAIEILYWFLQPKRGNENVMKGEKQR